VARPTNAAMTPATATALQAYKQRSVLSATPEQLVVMLYEGAVRFLRQAAAGMREGRLDVSTQRVQRAGAILDELLSTLDLEQGGEIAANLRDLYLFCHRQINEAVVARDGVKLDEIAALLADLGDAWAQLARR
jgi:flagellar secretion chaperone FliS